MITVIADRRLQMGALAAFAVAFTVCSINYVSPASAQEAADITKFCGSKPLRIGYATGFSGNSWRMIAKAELVDEASKCRNIKEIRDTDSQFDPQKSISDIQGLATQGVDAIVTLPDVGPALLPAIREAHDAGVIIVPYLAGPGGKAGVDYTDAALPDTAAIGEAWAEWMAKVLRGKGKVIFLGGGPGNSSDKAMFDAVKAVFEKHKDLEIVGGIQVTNYSAAEAQKVTAGLLAKYPDIDGVIDTYGGSAIGAIRAFVSAKRSLVPFATSDLNELGCAYQDYKATNKNFELFSIGSYSWLVRIALRKAVAASAGLKDDEPSIVKPVLIEDSTDPSKMPKCHRDLPMDASLSAHLTPAQLKKLFAK